MRHSTGTGAFGAHGGEGRLGRRRVWVGATCLTLLALAALFAALTLVDMRQEDYAGRLARRVALLEAQIEAHTGLGVDPAAAETRVHGACTARTSLCHEHCAAATRGLAKFATQCQEERISKSERQTRDGVDVISNFCGTDYDHAVCIRSPRGDYAFPPREQECVVLDFGIRQQPQLSEALSLPPFNCTVHAFDPSPITLKWVESSGLLDNKRIHFHPVGAGGHDGVAKLAGYNWGQISIMHPFDARECALSADSSDKAVPYVRQCRNAGIKLPAQSLEVNVSTLPTILDELGLLHVDIIKVDVEGSEWGFISQALLHYAARGLPFPADQLALEVHHFTQSPLYGAARSPEVSELSSLLSSLGGMDLWLNYLPGGWATDPLQAELPPARYNLLSYLAKVPRGTVRAAPSPLSTVASQQSLI